MNPEKGFWIRMIILSNFDNFSELWVLADLIWVSGTMLLRLSSVAFVYIICAGLYTGDSGLTHTSYSLYDFVYVMTCTLSAAMIYDAFIESDMNNADCMLQRPSGHHTTKLVHPKPVAVRIDCAAS